MELRTIKRTLKIFFQVRLKPDRYYEVTNGTELTFADVKCQYFIGQPPTNQIAATEPVAAGGAPEICQETTQPQVCYHNNCMIAFLNFHTNFASSKFA